ncbi:hypothetical protein Pr1d_31190 [Bythopirellula goksoeyrii]|uniref:Stigma-specific protein, Stig1 n=1 Tax=Bythopirellula goksoeyrii TaxID=1400387 RepID=A0A5B9QP95_9BACT|nr:hypothetical protein Pr1d_31190 [Bythopirellula goksoeyrii]
MCITQHIAARILIWLAAIAIPMQGVPTVACECSKVSHSPTKIESSEGCCCTDSQAESGRCPCTGAKVCHCGEDSSCKQQSRTCCSVSPERHSCCSGGTCPCCADGNCSCGANCQCGKNNAPTEPVCPPVENNSPERIIADATVLASLATIYQPCPTHQSLSVTVGSESLTSLDRCITLCRFTI